MWDELENALAWYGAAPSRWMQSAKKDLSAAAEWIWIVLQGDFAEEQTTAQTVTGTVISIIPFVDQICDVRDIVANCKKINSDSSNKWAWVALVLTLIGLFPTLGSLVKGGFKVLFAYGRKAMRSAGKQALDTGMWAASKPWVEKGIQKFNEFLARPEVRKTLKAMKIDNPYRYFAKELRTWAGKLNVGMLTAAMDAGIGTLKKFTDLIDKWGSAAMKTQTGQLLAMVKKVRNQANAKLAEVLKPVQDWLNKLAQRLEVEERLAYRATTNTVNPHNFARASNVEELAAFGRKKPRWVDDTKVLKREPETRAPSKAGWFDIGDAAPRPRRAAYNTFEEGSIQPMTHPPGTVLYRVVDPKANDNSICWMGKAEFDKLMSKDDWRRRFAVWSSWNGNGEYVTYTVPPGKGLNVWEGATASQKIERTNYVLEGGARQIVLNPADLDPRYLSKREFTGWGYDDLGRKVDLVGVPILQTNLYK